MRLTVFNAPWTGRGGVAALFSSVSVLAYAAGAFAASADLPNPCQLVPSSLVASAFGVKHAPVATVASIPTATTCSYKHGLLTISVGSTAITNPARPATVVKVAGLPNSQYATFTDSKASQLTFYEGTAASGTYVVIQNYARIPEKKLIKIAKAMSGKIAGGGGSSGGTLIP